MAEKHTTLNQFKKLSLKLQERLTKGLEKVQHIRFTVTLPAANWDGGAQTVSNESLLANGKYCYFVYGKIGVDAENITSDGQITFQCEDTPDRDLTVTIIRLEINTEDSSDIGQVFNQSSNKSLKLYIDERFGDFYNALINERPIYFGLCDSDSKVLLDSSENGIAGRVIFQIK